jgi:NAD(P)-dependent dehydrogenase (short-subunit alcohol dehydrogenase family)
MKRHPAIGTDRVAVITGGASGIGLAAARRFGEAGMQVVIADLEDQALDDAERELVEDGLRALGIPTDVASRASVDALKASADGLGQVTVVMSNAGREGGGGLFEGEAVWRSTIETNLWGAVNMLQVFVPDMIAGHGPGAVICTGSKQGITLPPGDTAYNVSKAGLKALTESLAHELVEQTGSRVSAHLLIPGYTYTGLTRAKGVTEKPEAAWTGEQVVDYMLDGMAAGDFYILCPDNEVDRATDLKRMRWSMGDIVENRPALSRWHPDFSDVFSNYMERGD